MGAALNRLPRGLLDFFGIKSGGRTPQELVELLQPVLPMLDWYMQVNAEHYTLTGADLVAGAPATFQWTAMGPEDLRVGGDLVVPQNEVWCVLAYTVFWQLAAAAADSCRLMSVYTLPMPTQSSYLFTQQLHGQISSVATQESSGFTISDTPVFVPPGASLRYTSTLATTANPITVGGRLRMCRMKI